MVKIKKIKTRFKNMLLYKIAKLRKENKTLKSKISEFVLKEQEYIDKMNLMKSEIRSLNLDERSKNKEK